MKRAYFWGVAVLNAVFAIGYLFNVEADIVPVHYGVSGAADSYASKWFYLVLVLLPLALLAAYEIYRRRTAENPDVRKNRRIEDLLIPAISLVYVGICWALLLPLRTGAGRLDAASGAAIVFMLGVLMIYMGNYMGKLQPNRTFGIRCKWTLADDVVWRATHRFGAISGTVGGLLMALGAAVGWKAGHTFLFSVIGTALGVLLTVVLPLLYARNLYNRRHPS